MSKFSRFEAVYVLAGCLLLTACGDQGTYVSFGGKAAGQPVFCISNKPNCAAPGAQLSELSVDELDDSGNRIKTVWQINASNSWLYKQYSIAYGALPAGWVQRVQAEQLVAGHHYRVNGQYGFSITSNGLVQSEGTVGSPG